MNSPLPKVNLSDFYYKKVFSPNFANIFTAANVLFGDGMLHGYTGTFQGKEGGIQVLAGLAPSS
jgi:hypothetical protein